MHLTIMLNKKIVVLDFGSQYNQLIVRRVRELGVYAELWDHDTSLEKLRDPGIVGIILSGGPDHVFESSAFTVDKQIFELNKPILGICYGMQLMAHLLGGEVQTAPKGEYGLTNVTINNDNPLLKGLSKSQDVWMSHDDKVVKLPTDFVNLASSEATQHVIMAHTNKPLYGIQFHTEVAHTVHGQELLHNFVYGICGSEKNWDMDTFIELQVKQIKEEVKDAQVICGLSGGVDSSVVAALIEKAIGNQLTCIFVDHGLMRKNEGFYVEETFAKHFNVNLVHVKAQKRFLNKLSGVIDPEAKRKIIGEEFVRVFEEETTKLQDAQYLAQGTLYTDVIESGTKTAQTIKSHHNVGGLPEDMKLKLIEPLNTLFKDEVRELGRKLGLPENMVSRQPFPGPGLGIRIVGDITEDKVRIVQDSDVILHEEIEKANLTSHIWQFFTVLTNTRSVGVMGDQRTYDYALAIRAVTSVDGMTADFAHIPFDVLSKISTRIVNEVDGVNRILYDITSKPPGTIEWE